jgi:hypothetical protein
MSEPNFQRLLKLRIFWGALLSSLSIYAGLTFVLTKPEGFIEDPNRLPLFAGMFAVVSLAQLTLIPFLRQLLFWRPLGRGDITPDQLIPRFFTTSLVSWALCEAVAVFGFALYMLTYERPPALAFIAVGALAMLSLVPVKLPKHPNAAGGTW